MIEPTQERLPKTLKGLQSDSPMIHLITLDLDNTLWDIEKTMVRAEKELRMHLKSVSEKAFDIYCSDTTSEIRNRLLREQPDLRSNLTEFRKVLLSEIFFRAGNSIQDSKILASSAFNTFFEFRNKVVFFEGAIDVLTTLSEKYKVYALTNGNADVKVIGIDKYLSGAVSSAEVGVSKPSPEIFEAVLNKAGEKAKSCIHVGDDYEDDIVGANNAGIASIWLNHRHQSGPSMNLATKVVSKVTEIPRAVELISGTR
jgi:HAD superfamily hydrolase (TIGR01549 family)